MINYVIYTVLSLGGTFFVYQGFLKKQKTFGFNRFFLISSLILCLLAPILEIKIFNALPSITEVSFETSDAQIITEDVLIGTSIEQIQHNPIGLFDVFWYVYWIVSACLLFRFTRNLISILKLIKGTSSQIGKMKMIEVKEQKNVSSFFNYLFVNPESLHDGVYANSVVHHEHVHYNQLHSLDIILIEILLCVFWFNPFVWLYKKAILQNHEFVADAHTVNKGINIEDYSQTIINSSYKGHRVPLSSGFNFIQIKNRITMLHQSKSSVLKRTLKITAALLLFTGIFVFSSFKNLKEPLIVVIDAGHGGHDSGNLMEKDVVLNISNMLAGYSDEKVKIIVTRNSDTFIALKDRSEFINAQNPDVFISLHTNGYKDPSVNGIEAFYNKDNVFKEKSYTYGNILVENQLNKFSSRGDIKTANFYLLKIVNCPSVFLELGFLTNEKDKAILMNEEHQKDIAKLLYESLLEIRDIQ